MQYEPFGLYRLKDLKRDSQRNIAHYADKWIEKRGNSKNSVALSDLFMTVGLLSAGLVLSGLHA